MYARERSCFKIGCAENLPDISGIVTQFAFCKIDGNRRIRIMDLVTLIGIMYLHISEETT